LALQIGTALPPPGVPEIGIPAVAQVLYAESLVAPGTDGRVVGRLSESWQWLENGTILQVTLPKGIRFHDGSPLTAQAVAAILSKHFRSARAPLSARSVVGIRTPSAETVEIALMRPEAFLPDDLSVIPVLREPTVGTGAFMLREGDAATKDGATLQAFPQYRHGRPKAERVDIKSYPTLRSAWTAMMRGDINMLHEVSAEAAHFVDLESSLRLYPFVRPYTYFVAFNMRHPVLGRRDVRQALSQAVDRAAIIRDAMRGRGEVADGPVWKYHWAYSTAQRRYHYNPDAARVRLDAAGFPSTRPTQPGAMPARFRFKCLMFGDDPRFERVALVLQKQLYDIGIDMEIEPLPLAKLAERTKTGDFDAFLLEVISGRSLMYPYNVWRSSGQVFNTGYRSADAALERLRSAFTEADTRSGVSELQRVFYDDPPALFLAWPHASRAISADIEVPGPQNTDVMGRVGGFRYGASPQASR